MSSIGVVVLNYLNYEATIECVDSLLSMQYKLCKIVIVDNGSHNESYRILKDRYVKDDIVEVVPAKHNLGFARGNNIGIQRIRQHWKAQFVYVVNSDVVFEDRFYFEKLLAQYHEGIGVMGSRIYTRDGKVRDGMPCWVDVRNSLRQYGIFFAEFYNSRLLYWLLPKRDKNFVVYVLHGCGLLFTPDFFRYYKGFYPKTFLYHEEIILYIMCQMKGLKQKPVSDTYIYHKGEESSELSFHNDDKVIQKYMLKSQKYVIWWAIKRSICGRKRRK